MFLFVTNFILFYGVEYYCAFEKRNTTKDLDRNSILEHKNITALWIVSHCETNSKREDYVAAMSSFIDIQIRKIKKC